MSVLQVCAVLLSLAAVFLFVNTRYLKLPNTVGMMGLSLVAAGAMATLQWLGFGFIGTAATTVVASINLDAVVIDGFLCLLLFVGAIHVDLETLLKERVAISVLATGGVLISTILVGTLLYLIVLLFGLPVSFLYCLVFGALISPTDAVTVLSFLKGVQLPESIESKITGESLLNDGMSIVLFYGLLAFAIGHPEASVLALPFALIWDILAAIGIGAVLGVVAHVFIKHADNPYIAIVSTLALATGSYALSDALGASGPIAVVVAGLVIGNRGAIMAENPEAVQSLSDFWDLLDELLNTILFVIIGLELLSISTQTSHLAVGILAVPAVLLARYGSIAVVVRSIASYTTVRSRLVPLLTWGGLRGGISIALVLALPASEVREILMTATYFAVIFSVFVQGPTLPMLIKEETTK